MVSEPWASMYDNDDMPDYDIYENEMDKKPLYYKELTESHKNPVNGDTTKVLPFMDKKAKKEITAKYYGMISQIDHHVGRILDVMEQKNLFKDTIIIFTTDHGDYLGHHGFWWKGLAAYDDIQRLPFIVAHPSCVKPGRESTAIQSLVDLGQTILDAAGIKAEYGMQGVNQIETWIDADKQARKWAMIECRPADGAFMQKTFIQEKYKLVIYNNESFGELYNMAADPNQLENLWADPEYQKIKADLMQKMIWAEMDKDGVLRKRLSVS